MKFLLPQHVNLIIKVLQENGFQAYAVGGCVRDMLLGREPKDWDITTNALPEQVKGLFRRTIDTGIQHGTVTIMLNHIGYEVTTYRVDGEYEDGRHPKQVEFTASLVEDLKRRDFTINAMAYNESEGLVDVFQGQEDLKNGIIRCVGCAKDRFTEDALRMMRAVRFAAQLGFEIEQETREAIVELSPNLCKISQERIQAELVKLVTSNHPELIRIAYETGITKIVLPEFDAMMETPQNSPYHCYNVGEHSIHVMQAVQADSKMRLAALLHDIGKPVTHTVDEEGIDHFHGHEEVGSEMAQEILRRLRMDNKTIQMVTKLIRYHDYSLQPEDKRIRASMYEIGKEYYPYLLELMDADLEGKNNYSKELNAERLKLVRKAYETECELGHCTCMKELAVTGKDLIEAGIEKGQRIGEILEYLLSLVIETPEYNNKEYLIKQIPNAPEKL